MQRNGYTSVSTPETRRNGIPRESHDALLQAKDRTIDELKEQITLLRRELERKEAILLRMVHKVVELLPRLEKVPNIPHTVTPEAPRDGSNNQVREAKERQGKPERPTLPEGYRVVATASDAWVLVAPRGLRVAAYRGELDLLKAALDARKHYQRE